MERDGSKTVCRRCAGCGRVADRRTLLRLSRDKEGQVRLDEAGKGGGRGAYLCPDSACLERARARRTLERTLRCGIGPQVFEALERRCGKPDAQGRA